MSAWLQRKPPPCPHPSGELLTQKPFAGRNPGAGAKFLDSVLKELRKSRTSERGEMEMHLCSLPVSSPCSFLSRPLEPSSFFFNKLPCFEKNLLFPLLEIHSHRLQVPVPVLPSHRGLPSSPVRLKLQTAHTTLPLPLLYLFS